MPNAIQSHSLLNRLRFGGAPLPSNQKTFTISDRIESDLVRTPQKKRYRPKNNSKWYLSLGLLTLAGYYRSKMFHGLLSGALPAVPPQRRAFSAQLGKLLVAGSSVIGLSSMAMIFLRNSNKDLEKTPSNLVGKALENSPVVHNSPTVKTDFTKLLPKFSLLDKANPTERKTIVNELLDKKVVEEGVTTWDDIEKLRPVMKDIDSNEKTKLFNQLLNNNALIAGVDSFAFDPDKRSLMFLYSNDDEVGAADFLLGADYAQVINKLVIPNEIHKTFDHKPAKAATATTGTNYVLFFADMHGTVHRVAGQTILGNSYYMENGRRVYIADPDFIYSDKDPDILDTSAPAELERWERK